MTSRIKRKPAPTYDPTNEYCSRPSTASTDLTSSSIKNSSEFPSLKYHTLIPDSEPEMQNFKLWQAAALDLHTATDVHVVDPDSDSESGFFPMARDVASEIEAWRESSLLEMDEEEEELDLDYGIQVNETPKSSGATQANLFQTKGRARSQTVPQSSRQQYGAPPPQKPRVDYLHLAEPTWPFVSPHSSPRREEDPSQDKHKLRPSLSRCSSGSSISFDAFWEQGGAKTEPNSDTPHKSSPSSSSTSLPPSFSIDALPTAAETAYASKLSVLTDDGSSVPFRTVVESSQNIKTIVCFIRHFLCPLCQDYVRSIARNVDPNALKKAGLRLVIIGNGGWQMIKSYRRIFKLPYPIYTDPTAALYTALGMTLRTLDPGPKSISPSSLFPSDSSAGSSDRHSETYVRHRSILSGVSFVLRNAVKARMPVWRYMGDKALLGGEFVFKPSGGPGKDIQCIWAHRMRYTTAHEEIGNVMEEAERVQMKMDVDVDIGVCLESACSRSSVAPSSMSRISCLLASAENIEQLESDSEEDMNFEVMRRWYAYERSC